MEEKDDSPDILELCGSDVDDAGSDEDTDVSCNCL